MYAALGKDESLQTLKMKENKKKTAYKISTVTSTIQNSWINYLKRLDVNSYHILTITWCVLTPHSWDYIGYVELFNLVCLNGII